MRHYDIRSYMLQKIYESGFRGDVSCCEYFACKRYTIDDAGVHYVGKFGYHDNRFMHANLRTLYSQYVTHTMPLQA